MAIVKVVHEPYPRRSDLIHLLSYEMKPEKCQNGHMGAQGLLKGTDEAMYEQMENVKKQYVKLQGRQAFHYVVSFSQEEMKYINESLAHAIGYEICSFFVGYQIVFCVHTDEPHLHLHLVMNPVSYVDGTKYSMWQWELQQFKQYVENCLCKYVPTKRSGIDDELDDFIVQTRIKQWEESKACGVINVPA